MPRHRKAYFTGSHQCSSQSCRWSKEAREHAEIVVVTKIRRYQKLDLQMIMPDALVSVHVECTRFPLATMPDVQASVAPRRPTGRKESKADEGTKADEGHRCCWRGTPPSPACPRGYPTTSDPSRTVTKRSPAGPARPALSVPIAAEPRSPSGEQLRTKIRSHAHLELALRRDKDRRRNETRPTII